MMKALIWLLRLGLAGVFVYAGVMKLRDPAAFAAEIDGYRLLPPELARWVAVGLPWFEVVIGVAVLLPVTTRAAALWQAVMMAGFTAALISAWWRGLDITCGCFGGQGPANVVWLITRDVALLAGALLVAWAPAGSRHATCVESTGPTCSQPSAIAASEL